MAQTNLAAIKSYKWNQLRLAVFGLAAKSSWKLLGCVSALVVSLSLSSNCCTYGFIAAIQYCRTSLALAKSSRTCFNTSLMMFYATTICSSFFPLSSIIRAKELQINKHKTTASDKCVLIWVPSRILSCTAVYSAPPSLITFFPSSRLFPSVPLEYFNWLHSLSV